MGAVALLPTGSTEAHLVAAIGHRIETDTIDWHEADAEITARIVSPALRAVSRGLGRQWIRAARGVWPGPAVDAAAGAHPEGPHQVAAVAATFHSAGVLRRPSPSPRPVTRPSAKLCAGS